MKVSLVVWLCLSAFLWAASTGESRGEAKGESKGKTGPDTLIFTNVSVVSTRNGGIEPNVTVVIKGGRIAGMAKVGFVDEGLDL